jgi:hypothetical protein
MRSCPGITAKTKTEDGTTRKNAAYSSTLKSTIPSQRGRGEAAKPVQTRAKDVTGDTNKGIRQTKNAKKTVNNKTNQTKKNTEKPQTTEQQTRDSSRPRAVGQRTTKQANT